MFTYGTPLAVFTVPMCITVKPHKVHLYGIASANVQPYQVHPKLAAMRFGSLGKLV